MDFVLDSPLVKDWRIDLELDLICSELTEENKDRVLALGYDPEKSPKYPWNDRSYWIYRCTVIEGELIYRHISLGGSDRAMEILAGAERELFEAERRYYEEKSIDLIQSEAYRQFLKEASTSRRIGYGDIVIFAPMSIWEKRRYLEAMERAEGCHKRRSVQRIAVSEKGEIWHAAFPWNDVSWRDRKYFCNEDLSDLDIKNPYRDGDVILIDCRPFCEPYYALVFEEGGGEPSWSPYCLWVSGKRMYCGSLKNDIEGRTVMSPLYRSEVYEGELPKDQMILRELSRLIKEGSPKMDEAYRLTRVCRPDELEERLRRLDPDPSLYQLRPRPDRGP
ncbi:MAG: hypothetical protein IJ071_02265 [Ruminococcus sp.]|nr:hypothetical protein [Ruminococcus sp.]